MATRTLPGTPAWLGARNDSVALSLLLEHGALTRNQIGELSGLSKPTAAQIVSRLEGSGLIEVVGAISAGRGPNAASYAVQAKRVLGVAIDVNEAYIRSTVVDVTGVEHPVVEVALSPTGVDRSCVSDVRDAIDRACAASDVLVAAVRVVALGVQGSVDPQTDELNFVSDLSGWPAKGIRTQLETSLGLDVHIDNDVNLAAIAERAEGAGEGATSFALLWMGEGLGLAVDLEGTLHRGAAGGAGEIGALPVPWNAAEIDPAARALEDLFGGRAIVTIAREHGVPGADTDAILSELIDHPARDTVFTQVARRVALGVVPVLAILDPDVIVLGGPVGTASGQCLADRVRQEIEATTLWRPRVISSSVPEYPVLRGARKILVAHLRQVLFDELDNSRHLVMPQPSRRIHP